MATFRTKPTPTYLPPIKSEIDAAAANAELVNVVHDIVEDVCNLASGGEIRPSSAYMEEIRKEAYIELRSERRTYSDWHNRTVFAGKLANLVASKLAYNEGVCNFLKAIDIDGLIGATPLAKAINMLKLLKDSTTAAKKIIDMEKKPEELAKNINMKMKAVRDMSDTDKQLILFASDKPAEQIAGMEGEQIDMAVAEQLVGNLDIMNHIACNLEDLTRMRAVKQIKKASDPYGDEVRTRAIDSMSEFHKIRQSELALPNNYRLMRIVTRAAKVRERVSSIEKKQLLYMIIDKSSSMRAGKRRVKACGVLLSRLRAVARGDAELYVRYFDTDLSEEVKITNTTEASAFLKEALGRAADGSNTHIVPCMKLAVDRINELMRSGLVYRPELVVVTDGCDETSSFTASEFAGTRVHAFVVDEHNSALCNLAIATGGVGMNNL